MSENIFIFVELHALCLFGIIFLYYTIRKSSDKANNKIDIWLTLLFVACCFIIILDSLWKIVSETNSVFPMGVMYDVNILYYLATFLALFAWFMFCTHVLNLFHKDKLIFIVATALPAVACMILVSLSPLNGGVFLLEPADAARMIYLRGPLFPLISIIEFSYLLASIILILIAGITADAPHLRNRDMTLLVYNIPLLLLALVQALTGKDFICLGLTIGLFLLYSKGIYNNNKENSELIYSLSRSFDVSYSVDMFSHEVKQIYVNPDFRDSLLSFAEENQYESFLQKSILQNVIPDDRDIVTENLDLETVKANLLNNNMYFIVYRVLTKSGDIIHNRATFMLAKGAYGKSECLLCIQCVDLEKIVSERTLSLAKKNEYLEKINEDMITAVANMVEARDTESGEHILKVKEYSRLLALRIMEKYPEYELTPNSVRLITSASALHDIGKIMTPDAILLKKGPLTTEEFKIMKDHSILGCNILKHLSTNLSEDYMKYANQICRWHHEKYDGSGYPDGLVGDEIPISAQIVSIADCLDALIRKRVYKDALRPDIAFDMILNGECGVFSEKLMDCFKSCREEFTEIAYMSEFSSLQKSNVSISDNSLAEMHILLVDDDVTIRAINRDLLDSAGAYTIESFCGDDAVTNLNAMKKVDVILTDMTTVTEQKLQCLNHIRTLTSSSTDYIPIIAFARDDNREDLTKLISAGVDAFIQKPLSISTLTRTLLTGMRERSVIIEQKLADSVKKAHTDGLTGVKNVSAYVDFLSSLNNTIQSRFKPTFAILMCDVNDLKHVNDTFGHAAGDAYIMNSCKIICDVFSHSPVFRIGGDEFIVVLRGYDYNHLDEKMLELDQRVSKAEAIDKYSEGRASFAAGVAIYDATRDESVSDVAKRADAEMYVNKKLMHDTQTRS